MILGTLTRFEAAQAGRLVLWLPVAMGAGITLWFSLAQEPGLSAYGAVAAILLLCLMGLWLRPPFAAIAMLAAAILAGFLWIGLRANLLDGPRVVRETPPLEVTATVADVALRAGQARRVILTDLQVDELWGRAKAAMPDGLPDRARVTIRYGAAGIEPGMVIRAKLILRPLPGPVMPGGFDFARSAWFDGLGAVGYALGKPAIVGVTEPGLKGRLTKARLHIAARIDRRLEGETAALAIALLTGFRGPVGEDVLDDLRIAGLAHLLAISGLHIGLVAGGVFMMLRFGLVGLWLAVGNRQREWPAKQIAAICALLAAALYLGLSGMNVPAQRAFIMTGMALIAVMMNRTALSMRLVAWAALAVMILTPHSIVSAGFQMSFAAVVALISFYEVMKQRSALLFGDSWATRLRGYVVGLTLTSIIAGGATGPIAAFHFGRVAMFGLLGNLIAMPIMGFLIMPMGIIALVLMPFGLEAPGLTLMGYGIDWVTGGAGFVANLPFSERLIPTAPPVVLLLIVSGGLWLCLIRGMTRLAGIVPIIGGLLVWQAGAPPQVMIADKGALVLAIDHSQQARVTKLRGHDYARSYWLRALGLPQDGAAPASCDRIGCRFTLPNGGYAMQLFQRDGLEEACGAASLIVAPFRIYDKGCPNPLIIDNRLLADQDSLSLTWPMDGMPPQLRHSETERHDRLWAVSSNDDYLADRVRAVTLWNAKARLRLATQ